MDEAAKQKRLEFLKEVDVLCEKYQFSIVVYLQFKEDGIVPAYKLVDKVPAKVEEPVKVEEPGQENTVEVAEAPVVETPEPATPAEGQDAPVGEVLEQPQL